MLAYIKNKKGEFLIPLIMFGYSTYYFIGVSKLPRPEVNLLLIKPVYIILVIGSFLFLMFGILRMKTALSKEERFSEEGGGGDRKETFIFLALTVLYVFSIEWSGFVVATWLYMTLLLFMLSVKSWVFLVLLPLVTVAFVYIVFNIWLSIPLPKGWFI